MVISSISSEEKKSVLFNAEFKGGILEVSFDIFHYPILFQEIVL